MADAKEDANEAGGGEAFEDRVGGNAGALDPASGEVADLDCAALTEQLGAGDEEVRFVLDDVADGGGQPAVGAGNVRAAIEEEVLRGFIAPPHPRGPRCAAGHTADDQDAFARGYFA